MTDSYASNCPISRPIRIKDVAVTADFNGIGFSPQLGWMFDVSDEQSLLETPPPGAQG